MRTLFRAMETVPGAKLLLELGPRASEAVAPLQLRFLERSFLVEKVASALKPRVRHF